MGSYFTVSVLKFFGIKFTGLTFLKFYSLIKHTPIELSLKELCYLDLPVLQNNSQLSIDHLKSMLKIHCDLS